MSTNELLLWMSARREGSWQRFRAAVEELHLLDEEDQVENVAQETYRPPSNVPLHQEICRNLQRLGHAEFFAGAGSSEWRVTPPSLAIIEHPGHWLAVVAGARSIKLLDKLRSAAPALDCVALPACPDQYRLAALDLAELSRVAEHAGLLVQRDSPRALLMSLPAVDDPAVRERAELPLGKDWTIERFSASALGWKPATWQEAQSASGLFHFSLSYRHRWFLSARGQVFEIPGPVGKFVVLRHSRRSILRYDPSTRCLTLPVTCRPPFLVERALILCSGLLPRYEAGAGRTGALHYGDVPRAVADLAAAVLRQDLR